MNTGNIWLNLLMDYVNKNHLNDLNKLFDEFDKQIEENTLTKNDIVEVLQKYNPVVTNLSYEEIINQMQKIRAYINEKIEEGKSFNIDINEFQEEFNNIKTVNTVEKINEHYINLENNASYDTPLSTSSYKEKNIEIETNRMPYYSPTININLFEGLLGLKDFIDTDISDEKRMDFITERIKVMRFPLDSNLKVFEFGINYTQNLYNISSEYDKIHMVKRYFYGKLFLNHLTDDKPIEVRYILYNADNDPKMYTDNSIGPKIFFSVIKDSSSIYIFSSGIELYRLVPFYTIDDNLSLENNNYNSVDSDEYHHEINHGFYRNIEIPYENQLNYNGSKVWIERITLDNYNECFSEEELLNINKFDIYVKNRPNINRIDNDIIEKFSAEKSYDFSNTIPYAISFFGKINNGSDVIESKYPIQILMNTNGTQKDNEEKAYDALITHGIDIESLKGFDFSQSLSIPSNDKIEKTFGETNDVIIGNNAFYQRTEVNQAKVLNNYFLNKPTPFYAQLDNGTFSIKWINELFDKNQKINRIYKFNIVKVENNTILNEYKETDDELNENEIVDLYEYTDLIDQEFKVFISNTYLLKKINGLSSGENEKINELIIKYLPQVPSTVVHMGKNIFIYFVKTRINDPYKETYRDLKQSYELIENNLNNYLYLDGRKIDLSDYPEFRSFYESLKNNGICEEQEIIESVDESSLEEKIDYLRKSYFSLLGLEKDFNEYNNLINEIEKTMKEYIAYQIDKDSVALYFYSKVYYDKFINPETSPNAEFYNNLMAEFIEKFPESAEMKLDKTSISDFHYCRDENKKLQPLTDLKLINPIISNLFNKNYFKDYTVWADFFIDLNLFDLQISRLGHNFDLRMEDGLNNDSWNYEEESRTYLETINQMIDDIVAKYPDKIESRPYSDFKKFIIKNPLPHVFMVYKNQDTYIDLANFINYEIADYNYEIENSSLVQAVKDPTEKRLNLKYLRPGKTKITFECSQLGPRTKLTANMNSCVLSSDTKSINSQILEITTDADEYTVSIDKNGESIIRYDEDSKTITAIAKGTAIIIVSAQADGKALNKIVIPVKVVECPLNYNSSSDNHVYNTEEGERNGFCDCGKNIDIGIQSISPTVDLPIRIDETEESLLISNASITLPGLETTYQTYEISLFTIENTWDYPSYDEIYNDRKMILYKLDPVELFQNNKLKELLVYTCLVWNSETMILNYQFISNTLFNTNLLNEDFYKNRKEFGIYNINYRTEIEEIVEISTSPSWIVDITNHEIKLINEWLEWFENNFDTWKEDKTLYFVFNHEDSYDSHVIEYIINLIKSYRDALKDEIEPDDQIEQYKLTYNKKLYHLMEYDSMIINRRNIHQINCSIIELQNLLQDHTIIKIPDSSNPEEINDKLVYANEVYWYDINHILPLDLDNNLQSILDYVYLKYSTQELYNSMETFKNTRIKVKYKCDTTVHDTEGKAPNGWENTLHNVIANILKEYNNYDTFTYHTDNFNIDTFESIENSDDIYYQDTFNLGIHTVKDMVDYLLDYKETNVKYPLIEKRTMMCYKNLIPPINYNPEDVFYDGSGKQILYTTDNGKSWILSEDKLPYGIDITSGGWISAFARDSKEIFLISNILNNKIFKSTNGLDFEEIPIDSEENIYFNNISVSKDGKMIILIDNNNLMWKSSDYGKSFTNINDAEYQLKDYKYSIAFAADLYENKDGVGYCISGDSDILGGRVGIIKDWMQNDITYMLDAKSRLYPRKVGNYSNPPAFLLDIYSLNTDRIKNILSEIPKDIYTGKKFKDSMGNIIALISNDELEKTIFGTDFEVKLSLTDTSVFNSDKTKEIEIFDSYFLLFDAIENESKITHFTIEPGKVGMTHLNGFSNSEYAKRVNYIRPLILEKEYSNFTYNKNGIEINEDLPLFYLKDDLNKISINTKLEKLLVKIHLKIFLDTPNDNKQRIELDNERKYYTSTEEAIPGTWNYDNSNVPDMLLIDFIGVYSRSNPENLTDENHFVCYIKDSARFRNTLCNVNLTLEDICKTYKLDYNILKKIYFNDNNDLRMSSLIEGDMFKYISNTDLFKYPVQISMTVYPTKINQFINIKQTINRNIISNANSEDDFITSKSSIVHEL